MKTYSATDFRLIFQRHFDLAQWQGFLVDFFGATNLRQKPETVKLSASEQASKGFLLGELVTPDGVRVGLFRCIVPAIQIERRRAGLRHLVDAWLKYDFDAALVVFDSRDTGKWRFSLISDMRGEKTSPKRYTYVFGDSTCRYRTAVDRFVKLSESAVTGRPLSYASLRDAFAVETLTKEFYRELFDWYLWALSPEMGVTFPNDVSTDKDDRNGLEEKLIRLITRIMFVWFIRQKKLVPDLLFDEHRMTAILKDFDPHATTSGNYYNAILQNLFFATLNNDIANRAFATDVRDGRGRAEDYGIKTLFRNPKGDSWFKRPDDEVLAMFREVPFLNGGLFECLDKAAFDDPRGRIVYNDGFSREKGRQRRAFIPNELFFADEGRRTFTLTGGSQTAATKTERSVSGLLKILDKYNFTIEENTPDDMDVALDPELLGKVFENLLGSFNPETRETARNSSGSFYTPREIVNYMVEASLDAYMKPVEGRSAAEQIEHLKRVKVLDPACGSGAFPMGMLNAIVRRLIALGESPDDLHALKLHVIEQCIYGVDIQTIAVQIAKLRFFISLVCEEKPNLTDVENNYGISPLPNLETKFVAADSLIGKRRLKGLDGYNFCPPMLDELKQNLYDIRHRHFNAKTRKEKLSLRREDEKVRSELIAYLAEGRFEYADARQLAAWNPYDQNESAEFFDPEWMFGIKDGFDIVIGNPPYIQLSADHGRLGTRYKACCFETFAKTGDIYCLFYERGWQLLKKGGHLCFITSNKWMRAGYGELTRKFLAEKANPQVLIDFAGEKIFESATVDTNILLFGKEKNEGQTRACIGSPDCRNDLSDFVKRKADTPCAFTTSDSWVILSPIERSIKRKIEAVGTPLKEWNIQINYGVKTGCNEAFIIDEAKRTEILSWCKDEAERARTELIIRPILRGRDIKRYGYEWAGLYLIATHNGIPENGVKRIDIADYPAIKRHLDAHWEKISSRSDKGDTPYNLRSCAYMDDFAKPKIVWAETMRIHRDDIFGFPRFAFVGDEIYTDKTCFIGTGGGAALKAALGVLNSKVGRCQLGSLVSKMDDGGWLMQKIYVEKVLVPHLSEEQSRHLARLVDRLLSSGADPSAEADLDALVYRLYGLTDEEIAHFETSVSVSLSRR